MMRALPGRKFLFMAAGTGLGTNESGSLRLHVSGRNRLIRSTCGQN
jgi:hypothetical protein